MRLTNHEMMERIRMCLAEVGGDPASVKLKPVQNSTTRRITWTAIPGEDLRYLASWRMANIIGRDFRDLVCHACWTRGLSQNWKYLNERWVPAEHCQCFGRPVLDCGINRD